MTGLDTNVLVRYLTQDDPAQARKAARAIEERAQEGEEFYITGIVLCELVWVLDEAYGYSRGKIQQALEAILRTQQFRFENKDHLWQALGDYRDGKADFADYLIGRVAARSGCKETLTFDQSLKGSPFFRLL